MKIIFKFIVIVIYSCVNILAQQTVSYKNPPKEIADIINAPGTPDIRLSPQNDWLVYFDSESSYPSLNSLKEQEVKLAGIRVNPVNNFPTRMNPSMGIRIKRADKDSVVVKVENLPQKPAIVFTKWSPNGRKIAFCQLNKDNAELWIVDVETKKAKKVFNTALSFAMDYNPIVWSPDSEHIFCLTIPSDRGLRPEKIEEEIGPIIQMNDGKVRASRTFQDLLKDKYDESLFEYYFNAELVSVDIANGKYKKIGRKGIFLNFDISPDGTYLLAKYVTKPYSYKVNVYSFPLSIEVYSNNGGFIKKIVELPVSEKVLGRDGASPIPRGHAWRPDVAHTLYWVEPLDEGNPEKKVEFRDKIVELNAPFQTEPKTLYRTKNRFFDIHWGNDSTAIVVERLWKDREKTWVRINPNNISISDTLANFSFDNAYETPGEPVLQENIFGKKILRFDKQNNIFLSGYAYSEKEGLLPILSRYNLKIKEKVQIWQSKPPYIEFFITFNDNSNDKIIVVRQSKVEPNNYANINLVQKTTVPITFQKNELLGLNVIQKRDLKYKRNDGVELNATLYFPANFDSTAGSLPTLLWAYPSEYKSKESAGKNYNSPYYFMGNYTTQILLASKGYAVLDNASFPIIGEGKNEPNDTYLEQIYQNAKAAIDAGVSLKIVDSSRVAVAGHSYGAFMAANLLTHTNLFKTGIAESGAYNRTLTPYGFQSEYRSYWQIPDVYNKMSPFQNANKLKYPILLIHGDADNNPGTFTLQSERYFDALRGQGANVKFVKLPYESHVYQAKESILHVSSEVYDWLEKYLKTNQKKEFQNNPGK